MLSQPTTPDYYLQTQCSRGGSIYLITTNTFKTLTYKLENEIEDGRELGRWKVVHYYTTLLGVVYGPNVKDRRS